MARLIEISGTEFGPPKSAAASFAAGDAVRLSDDSAFSGLQGKIESIRKARAIIEMLGSGRSIDVPLSSLALVA